MIEKIIRSFLTSKGIKAYMERPEEPPDKYCIIEKTGSSKYNRIKSATVAIESFASTLFEAAELNETVKSEMENIMALDSINICILNSDYNNTNSSTKEYSYQAVFDLKYY